MTKHNDVISLIDNCSREWRLLIELLAKQHGLSFLEWRVLICITQNKKIEQQQLARELNIAPNNITNITDKLVIKGFIKKMIKPTDKKIRVLALTAKKTEKAKQLLKLNSQVNSSWFSVFAKAEIDKLEKNLWKTLESIQTIRDKFISS